MYAFRAAHEAGDAKQSQDLRDESGERILSSRRTSSNRHRAVTDAVLRDELNRDLVALFNTVNLASTEDLSDLPFVRRSILNYGFPDISYISSDEKQRVEGLRHAIEQALIIYEPRLIRGKISITQETRKNSTASDQKNPQDLIERFLVRAEMRSDPLPIPVEFVTDVEFDTGHVKVGRL